MHIQFASGRVRFIEKWFLVWYTELEKINNSERERGPALDNLGLITKGFIPNSTQYGNCLN
jgi:hypothetical protein